MLAVVSLAIEGFLLSFHISVVLVVFMQSYRERAPFATSFFTLYLWESSMGTVSYLFASTALASPAVSLAPKSASAVDNFKGSLGFRLVRHGIPPAEWLTPFVGQVHFFLAVYSAFYEMFSHLVIATNRFTVIALNNKYQKFWEGWTLTAIILGIFFICVVLSFPRFFMDIQLRKLSDGGYALVNYNITVGFITGPVSMVVALLTGVTSFALEMRTWLAYRRMNIAARRKLRHDFRLLVFCMLGLIGQWLRALYFCTTLVVGSFLPEVSTYAQPLLPYINDIASLGGSVCLFMTSNALRRRYAKMYFFCSSGNEVKPMSESNANTRNSVK